MPDDAPDGPLVIHCKANGPLQLRGAFVLVTDDGRVLHAGSARALCRCGASRERPFCDGSHHVVGFRAD